MKMKTVYEANPALGDPMSIQVNGKNRHFFKWFFFIGISLILYETINVHSSEVCHFNL